MWGATHRRTDARDTPVGALATPSAEVPLFETVADDARRVVAGELPGRARDLATVRAAVPFAVEPLHAPALRLLAAWTTDLAGEPAAVLAYRDDDRLVLQYVVSEECFFRAPALRAAVAGGRVASGRAGPLTMVAAPTVAAGTVLVAELPARQLAALLHDGRVAGRPAPGAD